MDAVWASLLPAGAVARTIRRADVTPEDGVAHGVRGEPLWPAGTVGSITRAGGYRTVAVAPAERVTALGIDMERLAPLPPEVWSHFLDDDELAQLLALPAPQRGLHALSLWCLKEALFKAIRGRIALNALPLRHEGGQWRPAPSLSPGLRQLERIDRQRLVLRSGSAGGWQRAAAWFCSLHNN